MFLHENEWETRNLNFYSFPTNMNYDVMTTSDKTVRDSLSVPSWPKHQDFFVMVFTFSQINIFVKCTLIYHMAVPVRATEAHKAVDIQLLRHHPQRELWLDPEYEDTTTLRNFGIYQYTRPKISADLKLQKSTLFVVSSCLNIYT